MVKFDVVPAKTALLIIDMQNAFLQPGRPYEVPGGRSMLPKLNQLIAACRKNGILIVDTVHVLGEYGGEIGLWREFNPAYLEGSMLVKNTPDVELYAELDHDSSDVVITKPAYSAFYGTELEYILNVRGIDTLIIGGVATPFCCEATARDARHRNFKVIFLSDGNATDDRLADMGWGKFSADEVQRVVLTILASRYAEIASIAQILDRVA
ncbi:MAG: cysteine hydrolase [Betaproteobacteria bacterium]|nr:cysteine hydrolase [Betaproteobacteria bacterium]